MYPDQIETVKKFMPKFGCIQNHIIRFVRAHRLLDGVEDKKCSMMVHEMRIGGCAYVYNGASLGVKSVFCSDLECFLGGLDRTSVVKFIGDKKMTGKKQSSAT